MNNTKLNRRNFTLLLIMIAGCIAGGRSVFAFWALLMQYHDAEVQTLAYLASDMYMMFMGFLICMIVGLIFSFLAKSKVSRRFFIIRNAVIVSSLVLANMSLPNITVLGTVVMSKGIADTFMYDYAVSSPLMAAALQQPYLFYTYMAAEGLMIILTCISVYVYIMDKRKNNGYNNQYV